MILISEVNIYMMQFKVGIIKENKGSFTVEACIIVPVVIMSILALIMIGEFLYQQSCIQSIANRAAQRGAEIWNCPAKDMVYAQITKDRMKDVSLYWRIGESDSERQVKKSKIEEYTKYMVFHDSVLGEPVNVEVTANMVEDYIFYKKIRVTVTAEYNNPFASFLKAFGLNNTITIKAHSDAVINEPVEFIRSIDFAADVVEEIDNKFLNNKGSEAIANIKEGFKNIFSKVTDFIDGKTGNNEGG